LILPIYSLNHIYFRKFCFNWSAWEITWSVWDRDFIANIVRLDRHGSGDTQTRYTI